MPAVRLSDGCTRLVQEGEIISIHTFPSWRWGYVVGVNVGNRPVIFDPCFGWGAVLKFRFSFSNIVLVLPPRRFGLFSMSQASILPGVLRRVLGKPLTGLILPIIRGILWLPDIVGELNCRRLSKRTLRRARSSMRSRITLMCPPQPRQNYLRKRFRPAITRKQCEYLRFVVLSGGFGYLLCPWDRLHGG